MHELSIAMSMVEMATEELARQGGGSVTALHLKLGAHSGVVREALCAAYELAIHDTPLARSRLVIEDVPVRIHCPGCKADRDAVSVQHLCCSVCGTPSAKIVSGRELEVVAMEISDETVSDGCSDSEASAEQTAPSGAPDPTASR